MVRPPLDHLVRCPCGTLYSIRRDDRLWRCPSCGSIVLAPKPGSRKRAQAVVSMLAH